MEDMIYRVTKIEATPYGYMVTAKDMDDSKTKHRNHTAMVDDPKMFTVGSLVRFVPVAA